MIDEGMEAAAESLNQDVYTLLDIVEFLQHERDELLDTHTKLYKTHRRRIKEAELRVRAELAEVLDIQAKVIVELRSELVAEKRKSS